jgi:hypothetical protein
MMNRITERKRVRRKRIFIVAMQFGSNFFQYSSSDYNFHHYYFTSFLKRKIKNLPGRNSGNKKASHKRSFKKIDGDSTLIIPRIALACSHLFLVVFCQCFVHQVIR